MSVSFDFGDIKHSHRRDTDLGSLHNRPYSVLHVLWQFKGSIASGRKKKLKLTEQRGKNIWPFCLALVVSGVLVALVSCKSAGMKYWSVFKRHPPAAAAICRRDAAFWDLRASLGWRLETEEADYLTYSSSSGGFSPVRRVVSPKTFSNKETFINAVHHKTNTDAEQTQSLFIRSGRPRFDVGESGLLNPHKIGQRKGDQRRRVLLAASAQKHKEPVQQFHRGF